MTQIDWSQAPEGATHYNAHAGPRWWKKTEDRVYNYMNRRWVERLLFPTHLEPRPTQWTVEGYPPVGWTGEYRPCGHECEIIAIHKGFIVVWDAHDLEYFRTKDASIFRPLKSPRDRWVEAAKCVFDTVSDEFTPTNNASLDTLFSAMHDAMKSGTLPLPEVDQ